MIMVTEYQMTPLERCVAKVFNDGIEGVGFDGISQSPQQRGLDAVADYVTDYTLSAILTGLGVEAGSDEGKRILSAFVDGKFRIEPDEFVSVLNRGKPRKLIW